MIAKLIHPSRRTILLIAATAVTTLLISLIISILLKTSTELNVPSIATITALGVEAYWDRNLENKLEDLEWGEFYPGMSKNSTFYLRSISTIDTYLYLNTTNWHPADIPNYLSLLWSYNGTKIHPGEIIEVTLTLSASSSSSFFLYLVTNNVKQFSFNIVIKTSEYV